MEWIKEVQRQIVLLEKDIARQEKSVASQKEVVKTLKSLINTNLVTQSALTNGTSSSNAVVSSGGVPLSTFLNSNQTSVSDIVGQKRGPPIVTSIGSATKKVYCPHDYI